jgi:hypothetical protein
MQELNHVSFIESGMIMVVNNNGLNIEVVEIKIGEGVAEVRKSNLSESNVMALPHHRIDQNTTTEVMDQVKSIIEKVRDYYDSMAIYLNQQS